MFPESKYRDGTVSWKSMHPISPYTLAEKFTNKEGGAASLWKSTTLGNTLKWIPCISTIPTSGNILMWFTSFIQCSSQTSATGETGMLTDGARMHLPTYLAPPIKSLTHRFILHHTMHQWTSSRYNYPYWFITPLSPVCPPEQLLRNYTTQLVTFTVLVTWNAYEHSDM